LVNSEEAVLRNIDIDRHHVVRPQHSLNERRMTKVREGKDTPEPGT